ncbi:thiolase family protein [Pseudorhodoplanes sp.]|uniref:thiolase family protein n=1 Tax=Pseudorhodoplanes sp. TaxID=1934341 RepID=UPI003D120C8F
MALKDNAIVGFAEAQNVTKSGRDVFDFAGEVLEGLLAQTGIEKSEIDGLIVNPSLTATASFWAQSTSEYLGLELNFCDQTDLGGVSAIGGIARAAAALDAGFCNIVALINADTPTMGDNRRLRAFYEQWCDPSGLVGPPGSFGLLSNRYDYQYGLDMKALAKLAVTQRDHAVLNPNALAKFRVPITEQDYLNSRMISEPIRLLDCVMSCDGANGFLMMSAAEARRRGFKRFVVPRGYGESTNFELGRNNTDITTSGHGIAGKKALAMAGIGLNDIGSFHPYDDFIIAIMLTMEMLGFCKPGQGAAFIRERDFHFNGDLPLNTGGGQISAGQAGLAGGGTNLVEAVRQLFGECGDRQVSNINVALVTGIGWIPFGRNWGSSGALVLSPDA